VADQALTRNPSADLKIQAKKSIAKKEDEYVSDEAELLAA